MAAEHDPVAILLPVLAIVALTFVAFLRMAAMRTRGVTAQRRDPRFYRDYLGEPEPDYAVVAVRHYGNLFEVPTLFYVGCVVAFVLAAVSGWTLAWAWGYVAARTAQSVVHMTYNAPPHRGAAFVAGWLFIVLLWGSVGWSVVAAQ